MTRIGTRLLVASNNYIAGRLSQNAPRRRRLQLWLCPKMRYLRFTGEIYYNMAYLLAVLKLFFFETLIVLTNTLAKIFVLCYNGIKDFREAENGSGKS
jgi:hypothetical protein